MKQGIIYTHSCSYEKINIPRKEILRYMGCMEETSSVSLLIDEFFPLVQRAVSFKGSFAYFPISVCDTSVSLTDISINSSALSKNLSNCQWAIVFALTLGTELDRLIRKYSHIRPSAALCINSIATAAIEQYADIFCGEISDKLSAESLYTRPRFSPGYGDFSIEYQADILNLVNASKLCGINLTKSYLMTPSKSVTALMGVSSINPGCTLHKCEACTKTNCNYRR